MSCHVTICCHTLQLRPPSFVFNTCRLVFLQIISPVVVQSVLCTHANSSAVLKSLLTSQIKDNSCKVASTSLDSSVGKKKVIHISTNFHVFVNKNPTRCKSMQIFIYCKVTLHVSGVIAPIIRSTKNCNRSLRYRSHCKIQGLTGMN